MQRLNLERALVGFDLETTGTDVARDRIVEIALVRVEPLGLRETFRSLVDPERPIPPSASRIHGITDDDVRGQPTIRDLAPRIHAMLEGADLAGYNSTRFDLPLLVTELERAGHPIDLAGRRHVDAMQIFHQREPRDLTAAYRFYCGKQLDGAHSALADALATLEIIDAQLVRYPDLPVDLEGLHKFCNPDEDRYVDVTRRLAWDENGDVILAFGKNRGRSLRDLATQSPDYLRWMANAEFSDDVKRVVAGALAGRFPRRESA